MAALNGSPTVNTVEPLIKDTLNKGHLCIKDTFRCTNLYSGNTLLPLKEDNLSIMDNTSRPNVSAIRRFHCTDIQACKLSTNSV